MKWYVWVFLFIAFLVIVRIVMIIWATNKLEKISAKQKEVVDNQKEAGGLEQFFENR